MKICAFFRKEYDKEWTYNKVFNYFRDYWVPEKELYDAGITNKQLVEARFADYIYSTELGGYGRKQYCCKLTFKGIKAFYNAYK